jgi:putative endonuclease
LERFSTITRAIAREKQIKGWRTTRKMELIVKENPAWKDLSADWGKPMEPFERKGP